MKYALAAIIALLSFEIGTSLFFSTPASPNVLALVFLLAGTIAFGPVSSDIRSLVRTSQANVNFERYPVWLAVFCLACAGAGWLMRDTETVRSFAIACGALLCVGACISLWINAGQTRWTENPAQTSPTGESASNHPTV